MTSTVDQVAAQLRSELGAAASALAALAGPDAAIEWPHTLEARAGLYAAQLCQDGDDRLAAQTVIDVMNALWPHGSPDTLDPGWWRTPLGRMCARSLGHDDSDAVTHSVAAAMLGIGRSSIDWEIRKGRLDRHPDGGVLRSSVLQRIGR